MNHGPAALLFILSPIRAMAQGLPQGGGGLRASSC